MRTIMILAAALLLSACATTQTKEGFAAPRLMQSPQAYLASVPLGIDQGVVLGHMGSPEGQATIGGKEHWTYSLAGEGVRKYTYVFQDGVLVDVVYNDTGPYNGASALVAQK